MRKLRAAESIRPVSPIRIHDGN